MRGHQKRKYNHRKQEKVCERKGEGMGFFFKKISGLISLKLCPIFIVINDVFTK